MSNKVYNYPKSSCNCYDCTDNIYIENTGGRPTNLSVSNCNVGAVYDCYDAVPFKKEIEPTLDKGYKYLNPQVYTNNYAKGWVVDKCNDVKGCEQVYTSPDPTLIDTARGILVPLDRPPIDADVKLCDIYDEKYTGYGKNYSGYSDISAGQITYYVDKSIKDPYFQPNFVSSAEVIGDVYKDPMGAMKPEYQRNPLKCNDPIRSHKKNYEYSLSWLDDSTRQRENIMASQMDKMNQMKWTARWT